MSKAHHLRGFNEVLTLRFFELLSSLLLFSTSLFAQPTLQSSIAQVRNSTVFFVLPTAAEKLSILRAEAETTQNQRQKIQLLKLIAREEMEVDSFSRALMHAVEEYYGFSKYDFIADTVLKHFVKQYKEDSGPIFIVRRATTESGADALVMYNGTMQALTRPLPYYARLGRFTSFIDAFFGKSDYAWRDLDEVVFKWAERLENFHEKHQ